MKVLVVAAHPDDEVLGCGGTVARYALEGHAVYTLILGEGMTSRDAKRDKAKRQNALDELKQTAIRAGKVLGVKKVFTCDFPDNRFDSVPLLDVVKVIEKVKRQIAPEIVLTHFERDLNVDHRVTYQAVLVAARPMAGECVREIYSFEVPSSTEWAYPMSFSPDTFVDISKTLDLKIEALREYATELRKAPHPRSVEGLMHLAGLRGIQTGLKSAEAFQCVRRIV